MSDVNVDLEQTYTMTEAKELLKKAKGPIPGLRFYAEETRGGVLTGARVPAVVLAALSNRGKIQAELADLDGGPNHVREISDWHQCMRAPKPPKAKVTKAEVE